MSRHHDSTGWAAISRNIRPIIAAQLPLPCVNPKLGCPGLVQQGQLWDVGHLRDLALGGNINEYGPAHRHCNRSAGGRLGSAIATANRSTIRRMPRW